MASEAGDGKSSIYPPVVGTSFAFKLQDRKGRMHRFTCGKFLFDGLTEYIRYGCSPPNIIGCHNFLQDMRA
jgi:hypothetical protein